MALSVELRHANEADRTQHYNRLNIRRKLFPLSRNLTDDQMEIINRVDKVTPDFFVRALHYDQTSEYPRQNMKDLANAGLLEAAVPKEYGGLGANIPTLAIANQEIGVACPPTALLLTMHYGAILTIDKIGTEEQKKYYFKKVTEEGALFAVAGSEPGESYLDVMHFGTVAKFRQDGGARVVGSKHFLSGGEEADFVLVSCVQEGIDNIKEAFMQAIVPSKAKGVRFVGAWDVMAMGPTRSRGAELDVELDKEELIGIGGVSYQAPWSWYGLGFAATYLGNGIAAYMEARQNQLVKEEKERRKDPSFNIGLVEQMENGEMYMPLLAAQTMLYEAALTAEYGDAYRATQAINAAKNASAKAGHNAAHLGIISVGGEGLYRSKRHEYYLRNAYAGLLMPPSVKRNAIVTGHNALHPENQILTSLAFDLKRPN